MKKLSGYISTLLLLPFVALAQPQTIDTADGVLRAIENIGDWIYTIFLVVAVIMIVITAFKYLFSQGGEGVKDSHRMLLYSVVAVAIAVLAKGIVKVAETLVQ